MAHVAETFSLNLAPCKSAEFCRSNFAGHSAHPLFPNIYPPAADVMSILRMHIYGEAY
jgi:hypothetical protein